MATASLDATTQKIPENIIAFGRKKTEISIRQKKKEANLPKALKKFLQSDKENNLPDNLKKMANTFINTAELTLKRESFLKLLEFQKAAISRSILKAEDMPTLKNGADDKGLKFENKFRANILEELRRLDDEISRVKNNIKKSEIDENAAFSKLYETGNAFLRKAVGDSTTSEVFSDKRIMTTGKMMRILHQSRELYGLKNTE